MTTENTEVTSTAIESAPSGGADASPIPPGAPSEVSEREAAPSPAADAPREPLTVENIKDRARAAKERASNGQFTSDKGGETGQKPAQKTPAATPAEGGKPAVPAAKKGEKAGEKPVAAAPGAPATGEYVAPKKFTALGKEYDLPEWAQKSMTAENEKEVRSLFEKTQAFDHVARRGQELHGKYTELDKDHADLVGGVQDLRGLYEHAFEQKNILLLEDFFKAMKIPDEVVLNYALARAQLMELDPAQQQIVLGQLGAQREARDLRKQNVGLSSASEVAQGRTMALELNSVLAKPEVAPIVQAFDSAPGRKPGDFWQRVKELGEYVHIKQGRLLSPNEAVQGVLHQFGLTPAAPGAPQALPTPAAAAPDPAAAAPAPQVPAAAPKVPVVPAQAHRQVPVIPNVQSSSGSPTPKKMTSLDAVRKYRQEKYGS